jgi:hypothetical protein
LFAWKKIRLVRYRCTWEDIIEIYLKEMERVGWCLYVHLARDRGNLKSRVKGELCSIK